MKRASVSFCLFALSLASVSASCSESVPKPSVDPPADSGVVGLDTPSVSCEDASESIYGDPGPLTPSSEARGDVVKCAREPDLTKETLQAKLTEIGAGGREPTSNVRVYRIAYRTERGDTASTPSVSSALVYIPETPRADKLPLVVAARGSRGQAARCAVTKFDPELADINDDAYRLLYPLVAAGYAVILPDLAGYANPGAPGNPQSGYAQATDVARSTLDGSRALKKLFPALDDKVVLVGHSQGGHSALSALALADSYGAPGPIVATAVYAPLWLSQRSWGAILYSPAGVDFPLASSSAGNVSVWYHYTQAELLDGPGEGRKLFATDKQDAVEAFVKNECWGSQALTEVADYAHELFDPTFVSEISLPAAAGAACSSDACGRWVARYLADRPHLVGSAAQTPILLAYGMQDTTIPPDRMRCALDRLKADNAKLTTCVDPEETHGGIVSARGEYVADWIASIVFGTPAPEACSSDDSALTVSCPTLPPND